MQNTLRIPCERLVLILRAAHAIQASQASQALKLSCSHANRAMSTNNYIIAYGILGALRRYRESILHVGQKKRRSPYS